ncbi:hypothetical protein, partial [Parapusillimonas granuli]|uniref:hypothetical protein n=2 Tax=Parapusillimonas granuli TaxID=380911 RepID=UPI001C551112
MKSTSESLRFDSLKKLLHNLVSLLQTQRGTQVRPASEAGAEVPMGGEARASVDHHPCSLTIKQPISVGAWNATQARPL